MIAKRDHVTGIWTVTHTSPSGREFIAMDLNLGDAINHLAALIAETLS